MYVYIYMYIYILTPISGPDNDDKDTYMISYKLLFIVK